MQTIYFENDRKEQFKMLVIDAAIDQVLDQLNSIETKYIQREQFDHADLISLEIYNEETNKMIGELSFKKHLLIDNSPADKGAVNYH